MIQAGRGYADAPEGGRFVYALFAGASEPAAAYWDNNDFLLLGRVPVHHITTRAAWRFYAGGEQAGGGGGGSGGGVRSEGRAPRWTAAQHEAVPASPRSPQPLPHMTMSLSPSAPRVVS